MYENSRQSGVEDLMQANHIPFLQLLNGAVQYVVPRWQRRYCWGAADIERLVEDLLAIATTDQPGAAHYGGALLTFPEPAAAGVVPTHRVIDGQQRLTTVSILLACIADRLGTRNSGEWTANLLRKRLTNDDVGPLKHRKLRLQDGDEEEYRRGLEGSPHGPGAVTQAWRITRRLVNKHDVSSLLEGIERFRVVSIGLGPTDDPQQIFESLNATGRPLTESEKVKNWLLMGLEDEDQQDLHDNYWIKMEKSLGAEHTTVPVDLFLRDFLRMRIGKNLGIGRVHDEFRRWAVREGHDRDRPALCRELTRLAKLYGTLTGSAGIHPNRKVERPLRHIRAMGLHTHRPLTLRLLDDVEQVTHPGATDDALATVLEGIGTWITRLWLANGSIPGMNTTATELAYRPGPKQDEDYAEHWLGRIRKLRNTRRGVPVDEEVREGVRQRKAYGGAATRSTFAVLCALMEEEHREEAPSRDRLTVEHVMPRKLTAEWRQDLGEDAEDVHGRYRDLMANLTLSGDVTNSGMGSGSFDAKREVYKGSPIGITNRLADEDKWDQAALRRRSEYLAQIALKRWPWPDKAGARVSDESLRWRVGDGPWHGESAASQMVLNVAAALLSLDPENAERLSGDAIRPNIHLATRYPPGTKAGSMTMRAIPGHPEYVLYPYMKNYGASAKRCRKMGERCGVTVEVKTPERSQAQEFWRFLTEHTGGVPGQKETWRGEVQWTASLNSQGDGVGIYVGSERLSLWVRSGQYQASPQRASRMRGYSQMIRRHMGDQMLHGDSDKASSKGTSVFVRRDWTRDNEDEWPEAAEWIVDQSTRLQGLIADPAG